MGIANRVKKLVFFIIAIIIGIVVLLSAIEVFFVMQRTEKSVSELYAEDCKKITEAYSEVVSIRLSEYIKQMRMYTEADVTQTEDPKQIQSWLIDHAGSRTPDFDRIGYVAPDGNFYNDQGKVTNVIDRSYYISIMKAGNDTDIDDPVISKSTGTTIIHVSQATKVNGRTSGFYSAVVGVDKLTEFVSSIRIGRTGYAVLYNSDGAVIVTSRQNAAEENDAEGEALEKALEPVAQALVSGESGSMWVSAGKYGKKFATYHPITNAKWGLAFVIDDKEVYATSREIVLTLSVAGIILGLSLILGIGLAIFRALKPLEGVKSAIEDIASGKADLTQRITGSGAEAANEIGGVIRGFNKFIEKLHMIVASVKDSKVILVETGESLKNSTTDTAASITQIISNIQSMGNNISVQSQSVQSTAGAVNEIASNIDSLNKMISDQVLSVSQASSAVEEMVGNINSVNNSVEKMAESFAALEERAMSGAQKQQNVSERVEKIVVQSQMLQEANKVIASIASQTNLLAMNAAIEAAHAGESGKGFSVVADEIRKLSETSSAQSKTIGEELKNISESINSIVEASNESREAFDSVADGIRNTDVIVHQIKGAMEEQTAGSKQIIDALRTVNDSSSTVKCASAEMSEGNKAILQEIHQLQDATLSMKQGMDEMSIGAQKINETGALLSSLSGKMEESISAIGVQIDQFQV